MDQMWKCLKRYMASTACLGERCSTNMCDLLRKLPEMWYATPWIVCSLLVGSGNSESMFLRVVLDDGRLTLKDIDDWVHKINLPRCTKLGANLFETDMQKQGAAIYVGMRAIALMP